MVSAQSEPKAFGVVLPVGDEVIACLCPQCRVASAQCDRVGNRIYAECRTCHWTGAKTISRERMRDGTVAYRERSI